MNLSASVRDHSGNALPFQATLEADNKIVQALLPDGSYTLQISAQPQRFMGTQNEQAAAKSWIGTVEAAVSGHDLTDLHLSLHPMPTGSVQLFKETPSVNNPQAGPFPLIDMNHDSLLASASDEQQNSEFIFPFADTLKNGLNATLPLPPGSYWLAAEAGSGFCEQSLTANGASLVQTPLQIDADQSLPPVTLTLRNDCAALTLSLPSRNAALLPGVEPVYTAWLVPQFDLSSAPGPVTLRPSSGAQATLRDLTPGRYRVYTFADPKPLEFRNPEVVKSLTQSGQDVFLEPGGAMTLTVEVPEP